MRIGLDYLPALCHPGGIGRYLRELVRALVRLEDRPDLGLWEVGRAPRVVPPRALGLESGDPRVRRVQRAEPRPLARARCAVFRRGVDDELGGVDVFHHAFLTPRPLPVRRAHPTCAVSELPAQGSAAWELLRERLARMQRVFVFSSDYRSRLIHDLRLAPEAVVHTPVGCEHWRRNLAELPARDDPPRIVVLGAVRSARRPLLALRGFERLLERGVDARLEFLAPWSRGQALDSGASALFTALRTSPARDKVAWDGNGSAPARQGTDLQSFEQALPARLASAACLLHLATDAGTPVTPLEALALGVPVVASRLPAFVEALGDTSLLVDDAALVREPDLLAGALAAAIESPRNDVHAARRALVAREFTWDRCARETLATWRTLG